MQHTMKVHTKYFRLLQSGKKTIELRLWDEKRQKIHVGDTIVFTDFDNTQDSFMVKVQDLYRAKNFNELCLRISPQQAGFSSKTELLSVLENFYPLDQQNRFGVVGILVKVIS